MLTHVCSVSFFFFSSRRRHTRCALVTGVQTCALPICQCDQRAAGQGNSPWPLRQGAQGPAAGGDLLGAEGSHQDPLGAAAYPAAATAATRSSMVAMAGSCNTSMRPVLKCTVAASTPASAWSRRSILAMHDGQVSSLL